MPDFPPVSVDVASVWAYGTRTLTGFTGTPRSDLVGADQTIYTRLDVAVSTRSSHSASDVWAVASRTITAFTGQPRTDLMGEDASFEAGTGARKARIDVTPAFETPVEASIAMDGTEKTLVEKTDNKMGLLEGLIDLTPMQAGDTIVIREYTIMKAAGSYVKYAEATYSDAQAIPALRVIPIASKRSIKVTAQQTAGTNRTLDVTFFRRKEA